ncbi:MAG: FAD:protein FMN transferase [Burkholderiaceae bacterium]|jgi:thiamine biosynthesis lipoprotein|nr:FAD:protein FMN transferase [Burkholderiaceae bacterium]
MDALLSPRRRRLLAAIGATALGAACSRPPNRAMPALRFGGQGMGSTWSVRIAGGPFDPALEAAARQAVAEALDGVVARMSTFDPQSEIGRFNRHTAGTAFALSSDTLAVVEHARQVARLSDGAFDPTVAPLVRAWGFGAGASARGGAPTSAELDAAVGWQHLWLDAQGGLARKALPALQLDLSGIAKGHAVDRAAKALDALGASRYMVEAGGEIRTRGLNAEGRPWQIAVERPDAWPPRVHRVVPLQGLAIATSGDYRNFYEQDGRRVHHEIDPTTRAPAAHRLASVSVVHEACRHADAMATALFVMGPERGLALAREQRLAALFIVREPGGGFRDLASPAFAALG